MSTKHLSYREFWEALEARLEQAGLEDLRQVLRRMADAVAPTQRAAFLEQLDRYLEPEAAVTPDLMQPSLLQQIADLKQEIQDYLENLDEEDYFDDEYSEETRDVFTPFEEPFEALLEDVGYIHEDGDDALAVQAYRALFGFFEITDEYGNNFSAHNFLPDIQESFLRYLHACYQLTPAAERATLLWGEIQQLQHWLWPTRWFSLEGLENVSRRPLPDLEDFLEDWIALLAEKQPRGGTSEEAWLREAIRRRYGLEGIIRLAREKGDRYPLAYLDWFEALRQAGDFAALLREAEQALQRIPPKQRQRAAVADFLAEAAQHQGEEAHFHQARRAALVSEPTLKRLLDLWEALPQAERTAEMRSVAQHIAEELQQRGEPSSFYFGDESVRPISPTPTLYLYALILGQQWEKALQLGQKGKPLGWSSVSRPQGIFTTVALMLLGNFSPTRLSPGMRRLWETIWSPGWEDISTRGDDEERSRLERALEETLAETQLSPGFEQTLLDQCLRIATARIEAIVGGQHRKSYHKAAALLVACGEMITARGGDGENFIATWRQAFPRHRAFQQAVEDVLRSR